MPPGPPCDGSNTKSTIGCSVTAGVDDHAQLDCSFESICESCTHFATDPTFQPVLLRQRDHATANDQTGRAELFTKLLDQIGPQQ